MPNNSSARREKGKKKKTVPPPLHKEDKASMDSISLPLSLSGNDEVSMDRSSSSLSLAGLEVATDIMEPRHDIMDPKHVENIFRLEYSHSITQEERIDIRRKGCQSRSVKRRTQDHL